MSGGIKKHHRNEDLDDQFICSISFSAICKGTTTFHSNILNSLMLEMNKIISSIGHHCSRSTLALSHIISRVAKYPPKTIH